MCYICLLNVFYNSLWYNRYMYIDYENHDFTKVSDRIRYDEDRKQRAIEIGKARRARDKSYRKGQHDKRKYVDFSIAYETIYSDIDPYLRDDDDDLDYKDVFYDRTQMCFHKRFA